MIPDYSRRSLTTELKTKASKYFDTKLIGKAEQLVEQSQISISFSKGNFDTYFICSGLVRDSGNYETKVTYKKRLEDTDESPVSSDCNCKEWTEHGHCYHVVALFLSYCIKLKLNEQASEESSSSPLPPSHTLFHYAVSVYEYGKILDGPHKLVGAKPNSTYSSLQYLLQNREVKNFPLPTNFKHTLVMDIQSVIKTEENENVSSIPQLTFYLKDSEGKKTSEISLFEHIYIFNWKNGEAYNIDGDIKLLIQKIRHNIHSYNINDIIAIAGAYVSDNFKVSLDGIPLEEVPIMSTAPYFEIDRKKGNSQFDIAISFKGSNGVKAPIPAVLKLFNFNGGELSSFKRKIDAYQFIHTLVNDFEFNTQNYKKELTSTSRKFKIIDLIDSLRDTEETNVYHVHEKVLFKYENTFIKKYISQALKSFGETFFRFSTFDSTINELNYKVGTTILLEGLHGFHNALNTYHLNILYQNSEAGHWSSRVRFERKSKASNWFDLELEINDEDLEILKQAKIGQDYIITDDKLILLNREQKELVKFLKKYTEYEKQSVYKETKDDNTTTNKFVIPFQRARIFELFELKKMGIEGALTEEEIKICETLSSLEEMPEYEIPSNQKDVLRPYQKTGFQWLRFLYENKLGACLADDMGLGKTLQTISFITSIYEEVDKILIVCPVTLLLNWEKEFKKFSNLDVSIYHGGERSYDKDSKIILTSYGILKREIHDTFADVHFDIFILDEVQHLKNIRSQGSFAARKLKADFRICLTGTPVENDLAEFYNILDLSIPGIWGDLHFFRTSSNKKSRLLARKTASPFILRRTKGQVLSDLPPKIENNVYLNFSTHEKTRYIETLSTVRKKIDDAPSKRKYGEILKGLLELRQRCLWQPQQDNPTFSMANINSTKIEFLVETLDQIIEEGHQAIVFSQFTTYLDLIQKVLHEKHLKLSRIDGSQSVKKRQEQVEIFQGGKSQVFLISLRAGGVGLNLTAASYVFVMDPWWNPAVESQAIDRAHRIGQKNNLTVYRPIVKGSVEEKVLELQQTKRELFQELLPENSSDELFTGKLTMENFEALLK
jgi:SNF2 family DNA or RNA helicase